jgi:hypothetical protein
MTIVIPACQTTVPVGFTSNCTALEQVGDPVVFSTTDDDAVERLTSNVYDSRLVVGIITEKPTPTTCTVITMGILNSIASGLSRGLPVWVSPTGGLTTDKPPSGHWQVLGNAISESSISVNIEMRKVKSI